MALEYEDLPQMQSLTPEPDSDTSSLKDGGGADDDADLGIKPASPCKKDGKNETIITSDSGRISPARACSPLYSYNKYDLKVNEWPKISCLLLGANYIYVADQHVCCLCVRWSAKPDLGRDYKTTKSEWSIEANRNRSSPNF